MLRPRGTDVVREAERAVFKDSVEMLFALLRTDDWSDYDFVSLSIMHIQTITAFACNKIPSELKGRIEEFAKDREILEISRNHQGDLSQEKKAILIQIIWDLLRLLKSIHYKYK